MRLNNMLVNSRLMLSENKNITVILGRSNSGKTTKLMSKIIEQDQRYTFLSMEFTQELVKKLYNSMDSRGLFVHLTANDDVLSVFENIIRYMDVTGTKILAWDNFPMASKSNEFLEMYKIMGDHPDKKFFFTHSRILGDDSIYDRINQEAANIESQKLLDAFWDTDFKNARKNLPQYTIALDDRVPSSEYIDPTRIV